MKYVQNIRFSEKREKNRLYEEFLSEKIKKEKLGKINMGNPKGEENERFPCNR